MSTLLIVFLAAGTQAVKVAARQAKVMLLLSALGFF